jgi:hypothetical protein
METIEVRYKPVLFDGNPLLHKYIIYTDRAGTEWIARAGPGNENIESIVGQDIVTEVGKYDSKSKDWDGGKEHHFEVIASGADLSKEWQSIENTMKEIQRTEYPYEFRWQNSNTSVDRALLEANLTLPSKHTGLEVPGSGGEFTMPPTLTDETPPRLRNGAVGVSNEAFAELIRRVDAAEITTPEEIDAYLASNGVTEPVMGTAEVPPSGPPRGQPPRLTAR